MMNSSSTTTTLTINSPTSGNINNNKRILPTRVASMAYPKATTSTMLSKIQFCIRQNSRAVLATAAFICFVLIISSDFIHDAPHSISTSGRSSVLRGGGSTNSGSLTLQQRGRHWGGASHAGYFSVESSVLGNGRFAFAAVTDLDELSKIDGRKPSFKSILTPGILEQHSDNEYQISFPDPARTLVTKHNEAGRGAEFSELTVYQNRLLTFDDRTGDVFEILNDGHDNSFVVPRFVITEGDGDTDKGMKWEWSTVKDGELYMGSMGKEYTREDGSIENINNLWIGILDENGELRREDWTHVYDIVRGALNALSPGYVIMEAVNWSPIMKKWVFLPRRISSEAYNDVLDEKRGGNKVVFLNEDFTNPEVVTIEMESMDPLKGFSSFAFIPGSGDHHVLAVRSIEEDCAIAGGVCKQRSYFLVIDITTGKSLSKEIEFPDTLKFEGVEFVDIAAQPPATSE